MPRLMTAALACLALVLGGALLAGCGDDDDDDGAAENQPAAKTETASPTGEGGRIAVSMKDVKFSPMQIVAEKGQTVVWTNNDDFPHTVTATKGEKFDSGNVEAGKKYEYKLDTAGTIDYVCTIHPNQRGTITVDE